MILALTKKRLAALIAVAVLIIPTTAPATHVFDDVDDAKFYAGSVEWAKANGITTGSPAGSSTFMPDESLTRGEGVTFVKRYDDNIVQPAIDQLRSEIEAGDSVEMTIGAAAFIGDTSNLKWITGCMGNSASPHDLMAGIQLPVGATITGITGWIVDTDHGADATLGLYGMAASYDLVGSVATNGSSGLIEYSVDLTAPVIVESGEYYSFQYDAPGGAANHLICGAAVRYTTP